MIRQIKMGFRMMRYAYALSASVIFGILVFLLGFISYCNPLSRGMGAYFLALVAAWIPQLLGSLAASNMVQSSGWKKKFETSIPALANFIIAIIVYALALLISLLERGGSGEDGTALAHYGMTIFIIMIYAGWSNKFYVAATMIFMVMLQGMMITEVLWMRMWISRNLSFGASAALGLLLIAAGALAQYAISLLVYRAPLSKLAQYRGLRKWL